MASKKWNVILVWW